MPSAAELTDNTLWLAPLAGVTDYAFRTVCKRMGADVLVSEMVSADGLVRNPRHSLAYAVFTDEQRPFGIQLFGSEPEMLTRAVDVVLPLAPDFLDLNMGCPVKKVVNRGAGSALMREPEKAEAIVRGVKAALTGTGIPLDVKFRAGWDVASICAVDFGKRMEQAGADLLTLHPRTRTQMYDGTADWELITDLKRAVSVPVVGNGDVREPQDAQRLQQQTGCDAVMVGRGVLGRPWLFAQIASFRLTGTLDDVSCKQRIECIREHYRLTEMDKGAKHAQAEMRAHLAWYTKGYPDGADVRRLIMRSKDSEEVLLAVEELLWKNSKTSSGNPSSSDSVTG